MLSEGATGGTAAASKRSATRSLYESPTSEGRLAIMKEGATMYQVELSSSYFPAQDGGPDRLMTIGTMLRSSVALAPDRPALKELGYDGEVGRVWTYADLLHDAERLARALASRHEEGARVAVYANNVPEWVLLELGCALAGVTLVTVNPAYQPRRAALRARAVTIRGRLLRR